MSLFDYPRINIQGNLKLNPGTANNDDYAGDLVFPPNTPHAGEPLALIDSKLVRARTYGMSDADFIAWVQKQHTFVGAKPPGKADSQIPAEWNYYGDMTYTAERAKIIGVQTGPGKLYTSVDPSVAVTALLDATFSFAGGICDVNSEGSPPATQFFIDSLNVTGQTTYVAGQPQKGACQWINFYRNVNINADGGAGGYVYHVMLKGSGNTIGIPGFETAKGLILRYYIYATEPGTHDRAAIVKLYQNQQANPATASFIATIAPLYDDEPNLCGPVGRLLTQDTANIPGPPGGQNNNPNNIVSLAPAVLAPRELRPGELTLYADFSGTFPDYFQDRDHNHKYDFGPVRLVLEYGQPGKPTIADFGPVDYSNAYGDPRGWVYEFAPPDAFARAALRDGAGTLRLVSDKLGTVLGEVEYYFVTNQQAIYAEQNGPGDTFRNQGTLEPATISVYQRGKLVAPAQCPPITVWQYRSIPLEAPGDVMAIDTQHRPGQPLRVDTSQPGNFALTFTIGGPPPPKNYTMFSFPPYVTNWSAISLRILPNDEDFSPYYVDPKSTAPVGNARLTFDVVYAKVLRTYYLLYPIMNQFVMLNSEQSVNQHARAILATTADAKWMTTGYMPRTRDMSLSRRTLLQAYCRKILAS